MNDQERISQIWRASCDALQQVVRDLKITEDELKTAALFFNRLGQSGMFPSLLAVGLGMTAVDVIVQEAGGTRPNMEGPFYTPNAPIRADGNLIERELSPDSRILELEGQVTDSDTGKPLAGAEVDFWQADDNGTYDHKGFNLRGIVKTDDQGRYRVRTIVPLDYAEHDSDPIGELFRAMGRHNRRAAHIHLKARMPGYVLLTTQLFMPDSQYLGSDYVERAVTPDLTLDFKPRPEPRTLGAQFDISLRRRKAAAA